MFARIAIFHYGELTNMFNHWLDFQFPQWENEAIGWITNGVDAEALKPVLVWLWMLLCSGASNLMSAIVAGLDDRRTRCSMNRRIGIAQDKPK